MIRWIGNSGVPDGRRVIGFSGRSFQALDAYYEFVVHRLLALLIE